MPLFGRKKPAAPAAAQAGHGALPDPPATGPDGLRSMEDHRDYVLSCVAELPAFGQQVLDALGLSIAEDVHAPINLPGFDNSAMDGYAVRADDVATAADSSPVRLPVVGEIAAGQAAPYRLSPGSAMKIMTGAPIPPGADAVVPYEGTDRGETDVKVVRRVQPGQHIRWTGEDVEAGSQVLAIGHQLGSRDLALLAAIGRAKVLVRPRPRVAVLSTGTELVEPGLPLAGEQQIYDSNSYLLAAACREAGAAVYRLGAVSDDPAELRQRIADQLVRADLIVSTGGVSQGDYDIVKAVMPELGATDFTAVAMQPGKPQGFGLIGEERTPMIMLPGNPVSAYVSFEAFVRPVIRKLMGATPYARPTVRCVAAGEMRSLRGRRQFARGVVTADESGRREVMLVGGHGSHLLGDLARANALVVLPEHVEQVAVGDEVDAWLIGATPIGTRS